jgi:hypothetical protein
MGKLTLYGKADRSSTVLMYSTGMPPGLKSKRHQQYEEPHDESLRAYNATLLPWGCAVTCGIRLN